MKKLVSNLLLAILKLIPGVNAIPAVRRAGTFDGAIDAIAKAVSRLDDLIVKELTTVANAEKTIEQARDTKRSAEQNAERAERVKGKLTNLLA